MSKPYQVVLSFPYKNLHIHSKKRHSKCLFFCASAQVANNTLTSAAGGGEQVKQAAKKQEQKNIFFRLRRKNMSRKVKSTSKINANDKQGRKQAEIPVCPDFEFPERLTRDEINRLVARRESEKLKRDDTARVMVSKDRTYLSRLQYIISEAQRRIAEGSEDPMLEKLEESAESQVAAFGRFILTHALRESGDTEDLIAHTIGRLVCAIVAGKYRGGNANHYIRRLKIAEQNAELCSRNGLKGASEKVYRALRQLESLVKQTDGREPEEITPEERYRYMVLNRVPERTAARYSDRTSDSFKVTMVADFTAAGLERSHNPYKEVELKEFTDQFDPHIIASHPNENLILMNMRKEGWDIEDLLSAGIALMNYGFDKDREVERLRSATLESACGGDIYLFYVRMTGDTQERTASEKTKTVRRLLRRAKDFTENEERRRDIKQFITLLFDVAEEWVENNKLHNSVFPDGWDG